MQSPFNAQNYNRYTYCLNNPLMYTDPSGYSWLSHFTGWVGENWKTIAAVGVGIGATVLTAGLAAPLVAGMGIQGAMAVGCMAGMAGGFVGGFTGAALNGGSLGQCFTTGFVGMVTGGLGGAVMAGVIGGIGSIPIRTGFAGPIWSNTYGWAYSPLSSVLPHVGNMISGVSNGVLASGISGSIGGSITSTINSVQLHVPSYRTPLSSPAYVNSSLSYNGSQLDWVNHFSDGSQCIEETWQAWSGGQNPLPANVFHGRIPNGDYNITSIQRDMGDIGYCREGVDFWADLYPQFQLPPARTGGLQIHPDGNYFGTNGCIGLQEGTTRLLEFYNKMDTYLQRHSILQLNVNY